MNPRPTLKDVAELANVSFKTVSRVVNSESGVSAEMANRVQAAIDELGYRRNHSAHALRRTGQTLGTIGVIHADITNPFASAVHAALEQEARKHDTLVVSGSAAESPDQQDLLAQAFVARRVDGLVVIPSGQELGPALRQELQRGTPVVFVDRDPGVPSDLVVSDNRGGAQLATRHLLDHGHRHIGFLGSREQTQSVRERRRGFGDVMRDRIGSISTVRTDLTTAAMAEAAVREMFADPGAAPSALFAAQNLAAVGAIRALHRLGLNHQVAIVGFDHLEVADMVEPGITTVPQDANKVATQAAQLLFERLHGNSDPPRKIVVDVTLVPRGSGELTARL